MLFQKYICPGKLSVFYHGTIIRTEITCKKIPCYRRLSFSLQVAQLAGGLLLKMLKYFEVMLNIFKFSYL